MFTMGGDFNYQAPNFPFSNIDKLLHHLRLDGRLNAFYSTPGGYAEAKRATALGGGGGGGGGNATKTDDFFPYADGPNAFWTARTLPLLHLPHAALRRDDLSPSGGA